jgi:hypothetical protein
MPVIRQKGSMSRTVLERCGAIRLPIVDVDFALLGFKNSRTTELLSGARRQVVVKAMQMLETAKRDQIDGQIQLDVKDIGLLLEAVALTVEWMTEVIHDQFDDEQT